LITDEKFAGNAGTVLWLSPSLHSKCQKNHSQSQSIISQNICSLIKLVYSSL